jgi:hypothetical protein
MPRLLGFKAMVVNGQAVYLFAYMRLVNAMVSVPYCLN